MTSLESLLSEMEERAERATPGPWIHSNAFSKPHGLTHPRSVDRHQIKAIRLAVDNPDELSKKDFDFIAASRTDVPRLVAALRSLDIFMRGRIELGNPNEAKMHSLMLEHVTRILGAAKEEG